MTKTKTNWRKDNETLLAVQTVQGVVFRPCQVPPSDHKGSFIICKVTLLKRLRQVEWKFHFSFQLDWSHCVHETYPIEQEKKRPIGKFKLLNF